MKRILTFILAFSFVLLPAAALEDVPAGSWFANAVDYVVNAGLMSPTDEGFFNPGAPASRGMVVTALWRLSGAPETEEPVSFSDVGPDSWYAQAAAWGSTNGIVEGSDGAFLGENNVTREQLALFLFRFCRLNGSELAQGPLAAYTDADQVSSWAVEGMMHAVGAGLITGSDLRLDPKGPTTRAQLAIILQRLTTPVMG